MSDQALPAPIEIAPGLYRHYKGGLYRVLESVRHSETLESMTLYRALYGQQSLWVRPSAMFLQEVEFNGVRQPRFQPVSNAPDGTSGAGESGVAPQ